MAILLLGNRGAESRKHNEGEMVYRVKVGIIFEGNTIGGPNALHIANCQGVLKHMVRVLKVTKDNHVQLYLYIVKSLRDIDLPQSNLKKQVNEVLKIVQLELLWPVCRRYLVRGSACGCLFLLLPSFHLRCIRPCPIRSIHFFVSCLSSLSQDCVADRLLGE